MPFDCKDCGCAQIWRDTQQKWWYEVMKGDVWTVAVRCRNCRRKERARRTSARAAHEAGLVKKRANR
ncbi:MAG: zinc-ribbon domain containing protein [Gammaproteobacteria bacterium]